MGMAPEEVSVRVQGLVVGATQQQPCRNPFLTAGRRSGLRDTLSFYHSLRLLQYTDHTLCRN